MNTSAMKGARDALREAAKQHRERGDDGHAVVMEGHAEALEELRLDILKSLLRFSLQCSQESYTDTGTVWEIMGRIYNQMTGRTLSTDTQTVEDLNLEELTQ